MVSSGGSLSVNVVEIRVRRCGAPEEIRCWRRGSGQVQPAQSVGRSSSCGTGRLREYRWSGTARAGERDSPLGGTHERAQRSRRWSITSDRRIDGAAELVTRACGRSARRGASRPSARAPRGTRARAWNRAEALGSQVSYQTLLNKISHWGSRPLRAEHLTADSPRAPGP